MWALLKCPAIAGIQMGVDVPLADHRGRGGDHPLAGARSLQLADIADQRIAPQYWGEGVMAMQQIRRLRTQVQPLHAIQPGSGA